MRYLFLKPFHDEVISQAPIWWRLIGGPAGVSHQMDHFFIQPICLQLHPDFLVQLKYSAWLNSLHAVRVSVGLHCQSIIPLIRGNVLGHRAAKQTCNTVGFDSHVLPGQSASYIKEIKKKQLCNYIYITNTHLSFSLMAKLSISGWL